MLGGPVEDVQRRLGVPPTGEWGAVTMGALAAYQGSGAGPFPMTPHGHPDPATLINLGYYDPLEEMNPRHASYVAGDGERPGTFGRDLATTMSQVPRWGWLVVGAGLLGVGYLSWGVRKK